MSRFKRLIKGKVLRYTVLSVFVAFVFQCSVSAYPPPEMFNEQAARPIYKPNKVLKALNLKKGYYIADIGSGGGYYTYRFSKIVGNKGKVYAVDINKAYLKFVKKRVSQENLSNVEVLYTNGTQVPLKAKSLDLIYLRNVYHHISHRVSYFKRLKSKLKPRGRLAIIDHVKGDPESFITKYKHYTPRKLILKELKAAGYILIKEYRFLNGQTFTIYKVKN